MAKFCKNCGAELNENQEVCLKCGIKVDGESTKAATVSTSSKQDKYAVVGMVLGLVSIIAWLIPLFGYPVTICGIVFSAKGLNSQQNKGKATVGLIFSILFLIVTLINSILGAIVANF